MLSHERVWAAIDRLAALNDLTPSGLAKRAGLDSTTFNKSKRFAADGRARWPSTESLAKALAATGMSFDEFTALLGTSGSERRAAAQAIAGFSEPGATAYAAPVRQIPVLGLVQAGAGGYFDDAGFPVGEGWDHVQFPDADMGEHVYALEITGDSMEPLYRDGDTIIVAPTASIRRGDRVVVKTRDGEVMAKILKRRTAETIELSSANPDFADRRLTPADIEWMARILWASQ
ncbi:MULTISPECIES: helix-turn-helix transcriptional regulator [unclassified Roseitalea]|uniref:S24 family peptidase n=1 Tax=unclassified Roseitalea TaxID=2639107 RepID=UPI00273FEB02|nr:MULTISPECIES: helix-turn-helix transcriptional regulator [unclassified Roseitalea]